MINRKTLSISTSQAMPCPQSREITAAVPVRARPPDGPRQTGLCSAVARQHTQHQQPHSTENHRTETRKGDFKRGCLPVPSLFPLGGSCRCRRCRRAGAGWCCWASGSGQPWGSASLEKPPVEQQERRIKLQGALLSGFWVECKYPVIYIHIIV